MSEAQTLEWQDVEPAAEEAFSIFTGQPELRWARQAWHLIIQAGLARYVTERERCKVGIRFLTLGAVYHDFCHLAFGESVEPEFEAWADALDITLFRIGQLVGEHPDWDDEEDDTEGALRFLADGARPQVVRILREGFGGSTTGLFLSLWLSSRQPQKASFEEDEPYQPTQDEIEDEILNVVTPPKMVAFEWIEDGCESMSPY